MNVRFQTVSKSMAPKSSSKYADVYKVNEISGRRALMKSYGFRRSYNFSSELIKISKLEIHTIIRS